MISDYMQFLDTSDQNVIKKALHMTPWAEDVAGDIATLSKGVSKLPTRDNTEELLAYCTRHEW